MDVADLTATRRSRQGRGPLGLCDICGEREAVDVSDDDTGTRGCQQCINACVRAAQDVIEQ